MPDEPMRPASIVTSAGAGVNDGRGDGENVGDGVRERVALGAIIVRRKTVGGATFPSVSVA
jgi:hypothetical protein